MISKKITIMPDFKNLPVFISLHIFIQIQAMTVRTEMTRKVTQQMSAVNGTIKQDPHIFKQNNPLMHGMQEYTKTNQLMSLRFKQTKSTISNKYKSEANRLLN